ncbi:hypothetical protein HRR78_001563 [Exophiala dermatitidis]|nr:hypothetical protein HRR75_003666 [Exophiala dermatitidis]KAJ4557888.1 hypothetical protein HRR78_001563 [Exophiala dermatitidis]
MRAKRSKKYRKIMSQYQMTFSFREPYQVLLDSNFLKACHHFHMPLQKYLENTLHGECRLFVTKCTLAKIMGDWERQKQNEEKSKEKEEQGSGASNRRSRGPGQPHGNELAKNKQHYILATADADDRDRKSKGYLDVRERARMIPGVPIVYVKRSVMILEELSGASESVRRKGEREKLAQGLLSVGDRKRKRADGEEGSGDDEDSEIGGQSSGPRIRGLKKAKGPNPLSVKKKKVKQPTTSQSGENGGDTKNQGQDGQQLQSKRKRKRRHAGAKQQSATADDAGRPSNSHASTSAPASEAVG